MLREIEVEVNPATMLVMITLKTGYSSSHCLHQGEKCCYGSRSEESQVAFWTLDARIP